MNSQKPKRLRSKNIIVTGSASGIGRATAAKVISEGAKVALFDSNKAGLNSAVLSMKTDLDQVKGWAIDIAEENSVKTAISHAVKWFGGRIDVLIHLAGIFRGSYLPVEKVTTEDWDEVVRVNLRGSFLVSKHVSTYMIEQSKGVIILTSSGAGVTEGGSSYSYASSKGGTHGLALTLDRHLTSYGIRVNELVPGQIETPMMLSVAKEALSNTGNETDYETTMGRLSSAESIASVLAFLASDEAQAVKGAINTT